MKDVAKQYEVEKYIRLQHSVESAIWNEEKGKWELQVRNGSTLIRDECDVFINASGVLKCVIPCYYFLMWVLIR
jgi:cation diffusion facilitator CzcD-associated flavoprotein CzcO